MFTHTRFSLFATRRLITIVLIAIASAGLSFAVLWRSQSVSGMAGASKSSASQTAPRANQEDETATKDRVKRQYGRLPMNFEVNQGQAGDSVRFLSRGHGYQVFLTDNEVALVLQSSVSNGGSRERGVGSGEGEANSNPFPTPHSPPPTLRIKPVG